MTHFPPTTSCDGVYRDLLVSTVTLSINVVSNKTVSPCEVRWIRVGGGGGRKGRRKRGGGGSEKGERRRRREEDERRGGEEGEVRRERDNKKRK